MILRNGKEIQGPELATSKDKDEEKIEKEVEEEDRNSKNQVVLPNLIIEVKTNSPPFSSRLEKPKKQDKKKEILEVFHKVTINIPLLDAIKQVLKYTKFLKNLCINKKELRRDEHIVVGENVLAILQRKLPLKCRDPGIFTIPCKIGHSKIKNAMLDLGVSIHVMPKSICDSLNLEPLKETGIIIQLADRTFAYSDGVGKDVLVQVDGLIFPADFYVFYMNDRSAPNPSPLLLGRTFLSIAQTKIDISKGTLIMKFDGEIVYFNIFDTMEHPVNSHSVFAIHATNPSVQEFSEFDCKDKFKIAANKYHGMKALYEVKKSRKLKKMVAFNDYLDPREMSLNARKSELHPD
ncbi:uncharacterized protein [Coffea arabica]|uniref:Aspartic peptidase DDI1-type domain-containing protein n=1 Tax=Coffea arabica TaxID=13443 RepID=A0A6P6S780_COFAR|nr:uncharacterized protein LOC113688399 [Coffea arabica]